MTAPIEEPDRAPLADPVIAAHEASFGYAGHAVVTGADLQVRSGEVLALLGPNGSGKSTLVKGLLALNDHLGGRVELFGTPLERFGQYTRLGYVPQRHTLSASVRATVEEIVAIGRLPHRRWWERLGGNDRAVIGDALRTVGLADRHRADVATLSGGQQRRVLIARALAAQPDILVMDEPTAGVDAASQQVLAAVLRRLVATGVTMLIVTHELAALRGVVDRIVLVENGRIAFDGAADDYATHQARVAAAAGSEGGPDRHTHDGHHHDDEVHPALGRGPGLGVPSGPLDARPEPRQQPGAQR